MASNPYLNFLSQEDKLQNSVMNYFRYNYPSAFVIHVPNEGRRTPFERFKFKHLGGVSGVPDILCFTKNRFKCGLAIELKVGYNKPTKNQKDCLERLKMNNWEVFWTNDYNTCCNFIKNYFDDGL